LRCNPQALANGGALQYAVFNNSIRMPITPHTTLIPVSAIKRRGAVSRIAHRFARDAREGFDDGWGTVEGLATEQSELLPPATQLILEDAKSIITRNDSPDIYFDQSINPYRGCEHGCIYCYARPTHSYLGYSPGLDFETKIIAKPNIAAVLRKELASPSYTPPLLNIGSATDCYQPVERELQLTRQVMQDTQHAFSLVTKSSGVERVLICWHRWHSASWRRCM
jgi:hypothetical protein